MRTGRLKRCGCLLDQPVLLFDFLTLPLPLFMFFLPPTPEARTNTGPFKPLLSKWNQIPLLSFSQTTQWEVSRIVDTSIVFFEGNLAVTETAQNHPDSGFIFIDSHCCDYSRQRQSALCKNTNESLTVIDVGPLTPPVAISHFHSISTLRPKLTFTTENMWYY